MASVRELALKLVLGAQDLTGAALSQARRNLQGFQDDVDRISGAVRSALAFSISLIGLDKLVSLADTYATLQSRLKLAATSQEEFASAQQALFDVAQETRTSLEDTVALYVKTQGAVKALGGTQQDAVNLTREISQAFKISGATAAESASGIQQFSQALGTGVLRGDEFNSVMENAPRLAQALAAGLDQPISKLRSMAEAGELTADKVVKALLSQKDILAREYASLPVTVEGAFTNLQNALLKYVGTVNEAGSITQKFAGSIQYLAEHLGELADVLVAVGVAYAGTFARNATAATAAALSVVAATRQQRQELAAAAEQEKALAEQRKAQELESARISAISAKARATDALNTAKAIESQAQAEAKAAADRVGNTRSLIAGVEAAGNFSSAAEKSAQSILATAAAQERDAKAAADATRGRIAATNALLRQIPANDALGQHTARRLALQQELSVLTGQLAAQEGSVAMATANRARIEADISDKHALRARLQNQLLSQSTDLAQREAALKSATAATANASENLNAVLAKNSNSINDLSEKHDKLKKKLNLSEIAVSGVNNAILLLQTAAISYEAGDFLKQFDWAKKAGLYISELVEKFKVLKAVSTGAIDADAGKKDLENITQKYNGLREAIEKHNYETKSLAESQKELDAALGKTQSALSGLANAAAPTAAELDALQAKMQQAVAAADSKSDAFNKAAKSAGDVAQAERELSAAQDAQIAALNAYRQAQAEGSAGVAGLKSALDTATLAADQKAAALARAKASTDAAATAEQAAKQATQDATAATQQYSQALVNAAAAAENRLKISQQQAAQAASEYDSRIKLAEAERDYAAASGQTAAALQKAGEVRALEVQAAAAALPQAKESAAAAEQLAVLKEREAQATGGFTLAEQAAVAQAKASAAAARDGVAAAQAKFDALTRLPASLTAVAQAEEVTAASLEKYRAAAQSAIAYVQSLTDSQGRALAPEALLTEARANAAGALETYRQALAQYTAQTQSASAAAERHTGLTGQAYDAAIANQRAIESMARARGDEAAATQAALKIKQLEVDKASAVADAKAQEVTASQAVYEAKIRQAEADKNVTESEKAELDALLDGVKAKQLAADESRAVADAKRAEARAADESAEKTKKETQAAKDQARAQEMQIQSGQEVVSVSGQVEAALRQSSQAAADQYRDMYQSALDFAGQWRAIEWGGKILNELTQQKQSVDDLTNRIQRAADTGENLTWAAQQTTRAFEQLDREQLEGLQSAIDSARQKLDGMRDSAKSLVDTLTSQIAQQQGADAESLRLAYENQLETINAQIDAARKAGDAATVRLLERARILNEQAYKNSLKAIADEFAESTATAAKKSSSEMEKAGETLAKAVQDAFDTALRAASAAFAEYTAAVKKFKDEQRDFDASLDDRIRDLNRGLMSADAARADEVLQITEKLATANAAIQAGEIDRAQKLRDEVISLADELAAASGSVSESAAVQQALYWLEAARTLNNQIVGSQEQDAKTVLDAKLAAIEAEKQAALKAADAVYAADKARIANTLKAELDAESKRHNTRMGNIAIEAAAAQRAAQQIGVRANTGGLITGPLGKSDDTSLEAGRRRMGLGGEVPGVGNSDTVPAMLTPGEFVVRAPAVRSIGVEKLFEMNAKGALPVRKFAAGGLVGLDSPRSGKSPAAAGEEITVNLRLGTATATGRFPKGDATTQLIRELKRAGAME